eukprot:12442951-Alexandrium_andersonii.AAC.1
MRMGSKLHKHQHMATASGKERIICLRTHRREQTCGPAGTYTQTIQFSRLYSRAHAFANCFN